jgi:Arc/MetJ-type ribon-helix-helix transcriptional regulator
MRFDAFGLRTVKSASQRRAAVAKSPATGRFTREQRDFLDLQVKKGRYKSIAQALARAVDLLMDETARQEIVESDPELRALVDEKARAKRAAAEKVKR